MEVWKNSLKIGLKSGKVLIRSEIIYFEIIYRLIGFGIILNIMSVMKSAVLSRSGFSYISQENIGNLLKNPVVLLLLAGMLVVIAYYDYLEITTLVIYCEARWQGENISLWGLWKRALRRSFRIFHYRNLLGFIALIPVIALSVLPLAGGYINRFEIPEFIMDYIRENSILFFSLVALLVLLNIIFFFFVFSFPTVILQGEYFSESFRNSKKLLKSKKVKTIYYFLVYTIVWTAIVALGFGCMVFLLWSYSKLFPGTDGGRSLFQFYYQKWSAIGSTALHMLGSIALWPLVIDLYHQFRGEEPAASFSLAVPKKRKIRYRVLSIVMSIVLLIIYSVTFLGESVYTFAEEDKVAVIAHRAGATYAPENTLAALQEAIDAEADIAEIDVQQTKDGVLIILHDANFRRTTGLNQKVWETEYATVQTLDAGSSFSEYFAGEPIPTLKEMLNLAKDKIQLMVELKSSGHEENLVEQTIGEIKEAGMENQCTLASMDLNVLKRIKEIDPSFETVYISTLVVSNDYDISYVDSYSVETTFLTTQMIAKVHAEEKKVYAWTANKEENIRKILRLGADGLVTDNPRLARYCVNSMEKNLLLETLTDWLYGSE